MISKNIVVLGGGIGGIVAANQLRNELPSSINITLIERYEIHKFAASYLWLMVNLRKAEKITAPLSRLVHKDVKIIYEEIKQIDIAGKRIQTENNEISYDYLIVALGTELEKKYLNDNQYGIHNFYTYEGAQRLRDELAKIQSGEIIIAIESLPYKCPGAPYEAAMLISDYITKRGLKNKININLYTPEPHPLPVAGPELGKSVSDLLENKGIKFYPAHQLKEIKPEEKTITFNSDLTKTYNLLIVIPKHTPPAVIRNSGLTDESGWIPVDRNSLETQFENVYAIGDVNSISIPGRWQPDKPMKLPKAGVFAHSQALTVSEIINSKIFGKEIKSSFCGDGFCMLEAGEDLAGFAYGDFFAAPHPDVKIKKLGKAWHLGKVLFERWWLAPSGFRKSFYKILIQLGAKSLNIPIKL
ncbi:MAG: FAD/NAD(P)-binding oxidoreductase [Ignavibacteria bacterium]|nr:FAD/NAD(P)-binding oxidoreductase [Ignavibacteria bacterium]